MPFPNATVVGNLNDYVSAIDQQLEAAKLRNPGVQFQQNWYRGISSSSYPLGPSLFRVARPSDMHHLNAESAMMQEFDRHAILRAGTPIGGEDQRPEMTKFFEMQHYGVPTRLLDWTTNPFVGLYFALSEGVKADNPAVWICDPWAWNRFVLSQRNWGDKGPAHVNEYAVKSYHPLGKLYDRSDVDKMDPLPVAVVGTYNTERMRAQRGVFTLFGRQLNSMEDVYNSHAGLVDSLFKIEIDRAQAGDMFNKLIQLGYTDSVAYPDFHGVALEIRRKFGHI
ncbi:FRG domain-containing protein [Stenotrophomonas maltophilia]|uniref:FRG domain-containing protein n=1 Tax=Stenotrophomonas maltophilia group TaxID=995085 RepID=UPI0021CA7190|nr:FRG domain-containing protein [Stenotrophomonas maltophilia]MCU1068758.1 FRG domain-containing protein [Stenotrophomonas maltophilia]MCU1075287.1 FRG domain-containing protein [Stenotrophomonas maltophilia]